MQVQVKVNLSQLCKGEKGANIDFIIIYFHPLGLIFDYPSREKGVISIITIGKGLVLINIEYIKYGCLINFVVMSYFFVHIVIYLKSKDLALFPGTDAQVNFWSKVLTCPGESKSNPELPCQYSSLLYNEY